MFSRLDPYFKTQMRQTENTDTRQAIRREEKQNGKKKDDYNKQNTDNSLWEDSSGVSVEALEAFLSQFLRDSGSHEPEKKRVLSTEEDVAFQQAHVETRTPHNTHTARALQAYQTMSYRAHPEELLLNTDKNPTSLSTPHDGLSKQEIRMIHMLIDQLKTLASSNIHSVTIENAESFLQGIEKGIKIAAKAHAISL